MSEKAVLISIKPEWVRKILDGEKTIEVRKSRPKLDTPFKCYIYCTVGSANKGAQIRMCPDPDRRKEDGSPIFHPEILNGRVVGEFVCDRVVEFVPFSKRVLFFHIPDEVEKQACLTGQQIVSYLKGKGYGWHISDLVIYDNPKRLREFHAPCDSKCNGICEAGCCRVVTRAPQSWQYVEPIGSETE